MVFNWVYRLLRSRHQEQMEHKAAELVQEAVERIGPSH
jgi:histone H3/H4